LHRGVEQSGSSSLIT